MSRVKKATFTPAYRMDRLERFARGQRLDVRRDRNRLVFEVGERRWEIKTVGRTTVKVLSYVDDRLDAELVVSDERAERLIEKVV